MSKSKEVFLYVGAICGDKYFVGPKPAKGEKGNTDLPMRGSWRTSRTGRYFLGEKWRG